MTQITHQQVEERVNRDFSRCLPALDQVTCHHAESSEVRTCIRCSWTLGVQLNSRSLTGRRDIGTRMTSKEEVSQVAGRHIKQIESGGHQGHNRALLNYVTGADKGRAIWTRDTVLGVDERQFSYISECGSCHGHGSDTCAGCGGSGETCCDFCLGSNQVNCSSCGGSGRYYSGNQAMTCSGCYGAGRVNCYHCYYAGYDSCSGCGGCGYVDCSPCDATGYFTHGVSFSVHGQCKVSLDWDKDSTAPWINTYLEDAIDGRSPWLPLRDAIRVEPDDIQRNEMVDYPLVVNATGALLACRAEISQGKSRTFCELFGESLNPLTLGKIGEQTAQILAKEAAGMADRPASMGNVLGQGIFEPLLAMRNNQTIDFGSIYPVRVGLLSPAAASGLLDGYYKAVDRLKGMRSQIRIGSWMRHSGFWSVLLFLLVMIPNALFPMQLDWNATGIMGMERAVHELGPAWRGLAAFNPDAWIIFSILGAVVLIPARLFFMVHRARTKWRCFVDLVICSNLAAVFLNAIFPKSLSNLAPKMPGLNEVLTSAVLSMQLLPEVLLLGLTFGLLRSRRVMDRESRKLVEHCAVPALSEDLGYLAKTQK